METHDHVPITFGICVGPDYNEQWLSNLIESIVSQDIPEYEIILACNKPKSNDLVDITSQKRLIGWTWSHPKKINVVEADGWLPHKKNLIAKSAKYDILCIVHDYYVLDEDWYEGVREAIATKAHYDEHWDLLSAFVKRAEDGERGPDWVVNPFRMKKFLDDSENKDIETELRQLFPTENHPMYVVGLNPHEKRLTKIQYVSGGYIMCRKAVFDKVQLNESMVPGQPEDIEWFTRVQQEGFVLAFNPFSCVYTQKPNKWKVFQLLPQHVERLKNAIDKGFFNQ